MLREGDVRREMLREGDVRSGDVHRVGSWGKSFGVRVSGGEKFGVGMLEERDCLGEYGF